MKKGLNFTLQKESLALNYRFNHEDLYTYEKDKKEIIDG